MLAASLRAGANRMRTLFLVRKLIKTCTFFFFRRHFTFLFFHQADIRDTQFSHTNFACTTHSSHYFHAVVTVFSEHLRIIDASVHYVAHTGEFSFAGNKIDGGEP
jgi:hypothetical protein